MLHHCFIASKMKFLGFTDKGVAKKKKNADNSNQ